MTDLYELSDADFEQAGYAYNQAAAEANRAVVEDPLEDVSDQELLSRWQKAAAKELEKRRNDMAYESARQFVAEEPRYRETQKNAKLMERYIVERVGADAMLTPDVCHEAFAALSRRGLLDVQEVPREPRPTLTDADLYDMPLDDLHELAVAESRQPGKVRRVR